MYFYFYKNISNKNLNINIVSAVSNNIFFLKPLVLVLELEKLDFKVPCGAGVCNLWQNSKS